MHLHSSLLLSFAVAARTCGLHPELEGRSIAKTAINNVHVFNGVSFSQSPKTIIVANGRISNANPAGATLVDGNGGFLIPGLIDAHCHVTSCEYLAPLVRAGVTTALDMGTPYANLTACRAPGRPDLKGAGRAALVNGSTTITGSPFGIAVTDPESAKAFIAGRVSEGVDHIKAILDGGAGNEAALAALVEAAHDAGKIVTSHVVRARDYDKAANAKVDVLTHTPSDTVALDTTIATMKTNKLRSSTTLIMSESIVNATGAPHERFVASSLATASKLFQAGIPIMAGSDSNKVAGIPAHPAFGESLHQEFALLAQAGLSPLDILRGATSVAAQTYRLYDRGAITLGMRADLVLLDANPLDDIENLKLIQKVWVAGVETDI